MIERNEETLDKVSNPDNKKLSNNVERFFRRIRKYPG